VDEIVGFNLAFCLELKHYLNDSGDTERALSRILPRDPGLFRVWRYKLGLMLKRFPLHLEALPLEQGATRQDLEDAERAVSFLTTSRLKRFEAIRRRYVGGSQACGAWGAELTYDPDRRLGFRSLDPRNLRWADGFLEPHDEHNPWVMVLARMPVAAVKRRKGWKVPADLQGDDAALDENGGWSVPAWLPPFADGHSQNKMRPAGGKLATVAKYYCRFEPTPNKLSEDSRPLDEAMWHMACPACGWRSPGQAEAMQTFPPFVASGCPTCGGNIGRVTRAYDPPQPVGKYGGKKLVICAPFSGHEEPFYEGPWEFDYPTFPVLYLESYVMPHRPAGQSDTQVLKTPVLASNALGRLAYETLLRSRPYFVMPRDGSIENAHGGVFGFDPENDGDVMYWTGDIPRKPEVVQGLGVHPSIFALYDRYQSVFRTNESTSELALTPSEIKDAKVGTVEQVTETGNVVIDDHGQVLYDQESLLLTCAAQALRELPSESVRYQDIESGEWAFRQLGGPMMKRVEIQAGPGQNLDAVDRDDLIAYQTLISMPKPYRRGFARMSHMDLSVIQQIESDEAKAAEEAMMADQEAIARGEIPPSQMAQMGDGGRPSTRSPNRNGAMNHGR